FQFTVTPVKVDILSEGGSNANSKPRPRSLDLLDVDVEPTETLTQSSITQLLSSKLKEVGNRIKEYSIPQTSLHYRKRIVSKWEALNYDAWENEISMAESEGKSKKEVRKTWLSRYFVMLMTGIATGLVALLIQLAVEYGAYYKFKLIKHFIDQCVEDNCLYTPALVWISFNVVISVIASALVTYLAPQAAGSGIPLIKAYLNGVKIPGLLRLRTLVAKALGVILSLLGGLLCGKEGPMVHSGSIVAAGFGRGRLPFCGKDCLLFEELRSDHEVRDLVSGGAAAGVSAAFGAPVGGTLFSVEEAASFWSNELTWRVVFAAMTATFFTNLFLSASVGHFTQLSSPGLVRFDIFQEDMAFDLVEFPIFVLMGIIGGLVGALFVIINYKLTVFRYRYIRRKWMMVAETGLVAMATAGVGFLFIYTINDCTDIEPYDHHHAIIAKVFCKGDNQHNSLTSLFLTTPESTLKGLLHDKIGSYKVTTLLIFLVIYFFLSVWTYGLSISSGVFIPSLTIGAIWGRLLGYGCMEIFPHLKNNLGKYALLGAASQLGGIVRTTVSIMVILVECTGDITLGLPLMMVLIISKWVGDFFSTGLYEMNIHVAGIPMLPSEPPPMFEDVKASDIMSKPVVCLPTVCSVGKIVDLLKVETSCGFPVVEVENSAESGNLETYGKLKGLILKSQLMVLLNFRIFAPEGAVQPRCLRSAKFRDFYNAQYRVSDLNITASDRQCVMDITKYMAHNPFTVRIGCSLPRLFRLFRGLGLRHLIIVNDKNDVTGVVTRKDLAKYRAEAKRGIVQIETLEISDL
ncbi:H(+)/Cl(-) exchange transporter 7, partial [Argonauta hians]